MSDTVKDNSAERLLLFTDAVVAIAITLLILPLVELVPETVAEHGEARETVSEHLGEIGSFVLSFAVIARLWTVHHRLFGAVESLRRSLASWNMLWLLTIVVMPFATQMVGAFGGDRFVSTFYGLTIMANMICGLAMVTVLRAHPELRNSSDLDLDAFRRSSVLSLGALVLAVVLALLVPALQYYSLVLLGVVPAVDRALHDRRAERSG